MQRRQNDEEVQNEQLKKDIRRLREAARRTSGWSDQVEASKRGAADKGYVGHKAAKMMKRSKAIEARCEAAIAEKRSLLRHVERMDELKISPLSHHSDVLVRLNDVAPCYEGRMVCAPLSAKIRQGERVCLSGRNGCGKSSLLKVIMGEQIAHTGTVELASRIGHFLRPAGRFLSLRPAGRIRKASWASTKACSRRCCGRWAFRARRL